ncbi:MAG: hypothetical protein EZS28_033266 [Streblomastix strix]|uniref:Uncharacterized protein n=1 Tax=Streblomastix strix TaxID=222440 RepID=A0A5J4ULC9_9EUKA|nr:MAG: hypothetical protein EZS28_033266 [Streblomastix strix]
MTRHYPKDYQVFQKKQLGISKVSQILLLQQLGRRNGLGSLKPRGTVGFENNPAVFLHDPQHQTRCSEAVDELNTFEDQSTSTSQDSDEVQER